MRKPVTEPDHPEITTTTTPLDWSGPKDPDNPVNWPNWKRHFYIIPPAIISFTAYRTPAITVAGPHTNPPFRTLGASIYTPSYPIIQENFNTSSTIALLPLSLYVLALGFDPLIAAPLSETYGRYIVYAVATPLAAVFTVGAGFSQNIQTLCVTRILAGLAFSPSLAIGTGSVGDLTVLKEERLHRHSTL